MTISKGLLVAMVLAGFSIRDSRVSTFIIPHSALVRGISPARPSKSLLRAKSEHHLLSTDGIDFAIHLLGQKIQQAADRLTGLEAIVKLLEMALESSQFFEMSDRSAKKTTSFNNLSSSAAGVAVHAFLMRSTSCNR
jgi:hypothetical protein